MEVRALTNRSSARVTVLVLIASVLFMPGCKHEPILPPDTGLTDTSSGGIEDPGLWITPINTDPCSPDSVYFQNTVFPILVSYCATANCHDNITHAEGLRLYDYTHIMWDVEPGSPNQSNIWSDGIAQTGGDQMPPSDHPQLSQAQEQAIYQWIQQGAPDNSCNSCDTTNVTYNAVIKPIFQNKCNGCHGGFNPGDGLPAGGLDLTQWSSCNTIATNSLLERSIKHLGNVSAMPPYVDGSYLPACDIYKLMIWVRQGAPNN